MARIARPGPGPLEQVWGPPAAGKPLYEQKPYQTLSYWIHGIYQDTARGGPGLWVVNPRLRLAIYKRKDLKSDWKAGRDEWQPGGNRVATGCQPGANRNATSVKSLKIRIFRTAL